MGVIMSSPIAPVADGKLQISETSQTTERKTGSTLGKEDFLMLLVTQMQYQDPLEPTTDTEFISQLAQFSSLEEMQNLNESLDALANQLSNIQQQSFASNLVGKNVIMNIDGEYIAGKVQYMEMKEGVPYLAINEKTYALSYLDTVVDEDYLQNILNKPTDSKPTETDNDNTSNDNTDTENKSEDDSEKGDTV